MWNISNLFNPLENSSILNEKTLNKKIIEKLSYEIFLTDRQENDDRIEVNAQKNDIKQN